MAVNLLVDFADDRFARETPRETVARGIASAREQGYAIDDAADETDRLCAWVDQHFAPSWWSSEIRLGRASIAHAADGDIAGFVAYDARGLRFPWLRAYADRADIGLFGPYGLAPERRGTGLGDALLVKALGELRLAGYSHALIPAVAGDRLIAMYRARTGARIVDEFAYDAPVRYRTTILASGGGTNVQNVIDNIESGRVPLDITCVIANSPDAFALMRARRAGIQSAAVVWDRSAESRAAYDGRVLATVAATEPDLILLLGWMHVLPAAFIDRFPEILNLHPAFLPFDSHADSVRMPDGSLIPAFRGAHAIRDALAAGVAWSGASVHRVSAQVDRGEIVVRTPLSIVGMSDQETVVRALRSVEHGAVLSAIRRWVFER